VRHIYDRYLALGNVRLVADELTDERVVSPPRTLRSACADQVAVRLVHTSGAAAETLPSPSLIKLVIKARRWWAILRAGEIDITRLAAREGVTPSYMTRVVRLAFLSPAIVDAIVSGTAKTEIDGEMLTRIGAIGLDLTEQARVLHSA
jgi:hypothetical protein